jgi:hypothetical protein
MPSSTENRRTGISPDSESRSDAVPERAPAAAKRQPWVRPRLECFGDVRQVTMGGTIGINESGNPTRFP